MTDHASVAEILEVLQPLERARAAATRGDLGTALSECDVAHLRSPGSLAPIHLALEILAEPGGAQEIARWADLGLARAPSDLRFMCSKAYALELRGDFDIAAVYWRRAQSLSPDPGAFALEIGRCLLHANALGDAASVLSQALDASAAQGPLRATLERTLGEARLRGADITGFALYQARDRTDGAAFAIPGTPQWRGEDLAGRTLLATHHLGFGDQMLLAPLVSVLAGRGAQVTLTCDGSLGALLEASLPGVRVVTMDQRPTYPNYPAPLELSRLVDTLRPDFHGSLLSLCAHLTIEEVAAGSNLVPLMPPAEATAKAQERVAAIRSRLPGRRLLGLVFDCAQRHSPQMGGFVRAFSERRSVPGHIVERLTGDPAVSSHHHFVSLHTAGHEHYLGAMPANVTSLDPAALTDFGATAAIVAALDGVVTVDCGVANLACKLGAPTRVLVQHGCDWRWGISGPTTPWLPAARVYRQPTPGDWAHVVECVAADLRAR